MRVSRHRSITTAALTAIAITLPVYSFAEPSEGTAQGIDLSVTEQTPSQVTPLPATSGVSPSREYDQGPLPLGVSIRDNTPDAQGQQFTTINGELRYATVENATFQLIGKSLTNQVAYPIEAATTLLAPHNDAKSFAGTPCTMAINGEEQYFARTTKGEIRHIWTNKNKNHAYNTDLWSHKTPVNDTHNGIAAGDPTCITMRGQQHLFYIDTNGFLNHAFHDGKHLNKAIWNSSTYQLDSPLNKRTDAKLVGKPTVFSWRGEQHVFARTENGGIWHYFWLPNAKGIHRGPWLQDNSYVKATSDPVGFGTNNEQHIFYNTDNNKLQHLWWNVDIPTKLLGDSWSDKRESSKYTPTGRPVAFTHGKQQHVFVRDTTGKIQHNFWAPHAPNEPDIIRGSSWFNDETSQSDPAAALINNGQHVAMTDTKGERRYRYWSPKHTNYEVNSWGKIHTPTPENPDTPDNPDDPGTPDTPAPATPVILSPAPHTVTNDNGAVYTTTGNKDTGQFLHYSTSATTRTESTTPLPTSETVIGHTDIAIHPQTQLAHITGTTKNNDVVYLTEDTPNTGQLSTTSWTKLATGAITAPSSQPHNNNITTAATTSQGFTYGTINDTSNWTTVPVANVAKHRTLLTPLPNNTLAALNITTKNNLEITTLNGQTATSTASLKLPTQFTLPTNGDALRTARTNNGLIFALTSKDGNVWKGTWNTNHDTATWEKITGASIASTADIIQHPTNNNTIILGRNTETDELSISRDTTWTTAPRRTTLNGTAPTGLLITRGANHYPAIRISTTTGEVTFLRLEW